MTIVIVDFTILGFGAPTQAKSTNKILVDFQSRHNYRIIHMFDQTPLLLALASKLRKHMNL